MSRWKAKIAKLSVMWVGWVVAVATTYVADPVEHADVEVELALGPDAPSSAIVAVTFEGAFVGQSNAVCAFVWDDTTWSDAALRDVEVEFVTLQALGETSTHPLDTRLYTMPAPLTDNVRYTACTRVTCGAEEPCGGRFSITLVPAPQPDASVDPAQLEPIPMVLAAVTYADPGELPGRATITLVETRP